MKKKLPDYILIRCPDSTFHRKWINRASRKAQKLQQEMSETVCGAIRLYPTGEIVTRADGAVAEVWAPRLKSGDIAKHVRYGVGVVREVDGERVKFRPHKRRGLPISDEGEWIAPVELEFLMRLVADT